jgi:hypothetical protein
VAYFPPHVLVSECCLPHLHELWPGWVALPFVLLNAEVAIESGYNCGASNRTCLPQASRRRAQPRACPAHATRAPQPARRPRALCQSLRYMHLLFDLLLSSHPVDLSPTIRALSRLALRRCGAYAASVQRLCSACGAQQSQSQAGLGAVVDCGST